MNAAELASIAATSKARVEAQRDTSTISAFLPTDTTPVIPNTAAGGYVGGAASTASLGTAGFPAPFPSGTASVMMPGAQTNSPSGRYAKSSISSPTVLPM